MDAQLAVHDLLDPALVSELKRIELRTRRSVDADLMGRYRSAFRGSGLIYSDLREYQPGDEVKNIHWKVTARTDKVYVKSYEEDRTLNLVLAVDTSNSLNFGGPKTKHRRALEFTALLALLAYKSHDAVGLCLFSDGVEEFLPPSRARRQLQRVLLSLLKKRELKPKTDIASALSYLKEQQRRRALIFIVSDFFSPAFTAELRSLAIRHDVVCACLMAEEEEEVPAVGIVEFTDAESGERRVIDLRKKTSQALNLVSKERLRSLAAECRAMNVEFITIRESLLAPLADLMQRRTAHLR